MTSRSRSAPMASREISPFNARVVLVALAALLVWGASWSSPRRDSAAPPERTDSALYFAVLDRVADGEAYYLALGSELRKRNYPTGSVFNWRPPILTLMLAHARIASISLLVALVVAVIAGTVRLFYRDSPEIMIFAVLMQVGTAATALDSRAFVLHEMWAGLCIGLSVLLYAFKRSVPAAIVAIAGLFVRELVAPYVVACAVIAICSRRRSETATFAVGGIAWLSFYAWHATAAAGTMTADALSHASWIQWGGPPFVLATIGFGGWLHLLPPTASAIASTLLAASAWAPTSALHARIGAFTYVMFFMVAGQPFNQYWGLVAAPTWSIGYGLGTLGIVRLIRSARLTSQ